MWREPRTKRRVGHFGARGGSGGVIVEVLAVNRLTSCAAVRASAEKVGQSDKWRTARRAATNQAEAVAEHVATEATDAQVADGSASGDAGERADTWLSEVIRRIIGHSPK